MKEKLKPPRRFKAIFRVYKLQANKREMRQILYERSRRKGNDSCIVRYAVYTARNDIRELYPRKRIKVESFRRFGRWWNKRLNPTPKKGDE